MAKTLFDHINEIYKSQKKNYFLDRGPHYMPQSLSSFDNFQDLAC